MFLPVDALKTFSKISVPTQPANADALWSPLNPYPNPAPIIAAIIEGVDAIENVRKIVGDTEPKSALPGTIRGDYAHTSYKYADDKGKAIANLVHSSGNKKEAEQEIKLWFSKEELFSYGLSHDRHII